MWARAVALGLLLAVTVGCAPSILGGGTEAQMQQLNADFRYCRDESEWAHFIPDFGATRDINTRDCMRRRGWQEARGRVWRYVWVGY